MAYTHIPSFTKKGSFTEDTEFVIVVDGVEYLITYKTLSDTFGNTPELLTELKTEIDALRAIVDAFPTDNPAAPIALKIADIPTIDGIYKPVEAGTYPNAGGLIYTPTEGITYFIRTQGVWAKDVTPINFTPTGVVEDGNTQAVSGGEVYNQFLEKIIPQLEWGGIENSSGSNSTANNIRLRTINKQLIDNITSVDVESDNIFINSVYFYNNGVYISNITQIYMKSYKPIVPIGANEIRVSFSKSPNTEEITEQEFNELEVYYSTNKKYNFNSISYISEDYDNAIIDLNTSENELGGILVNWGFNAENNIRIRSKDLISVKDGISHSFKNIKAGYVLNRIYRYKDGVYYNATSESPSTTFVPNHTVYNQIRPVWSKINNTEIITNEELNDFSFNLLDDSLEYKITEIAKNTSKIPVLESVVNDIRYGKYKGKTLSILSDSMSTFTGYIPVGNTDFYPQGDVTSVTQTWWDIVLQKTGMTLEVNNSWSGSPIAGSSPQGFSSRIGNIGNPDVCLIFGGTNDYRLGINIGDWHYTNTTFDLLQFKQAIQNLLYSLITTYPLTKFIFMTPLNRNDAGEGRVNGFPVNWNNEKFLADYQDAIVEACSVYGVKCLDTREIFSYYNVTQYTIEGLHLNAKGMGILADFVVSELN